MYVYRRVVKSLGKYKKIFAYYTKNGKKITDPEIIEYIKSLKIPPNYVDVEINLNKNAKLLATGYDVKGKKQYIYNPKFVAVRSKEKICNLVNFGKKLPLINADIFRLLNSPGISKEKLIALIIRIIMECNFRIGNPIGEEKYNSYGVSTMVKNHVNINGNKIKLDFVGKRGVRNVCYIQDPMTKRILKQIYDQTKHGRNHLFTFKDENKKIVTIDSTDVNDFLKQYGNFTTKDFRTWFANIHFIDAIRYTRPIPETIKERKKATKNAIEEAAKKLHHTVAICKKKYIVPEMVDLYIQSPKTFTEVIFQHYRKTKNRGNEAENAFMHYLGYYCKKK